LLDNGTPAAVEEFKSIAGVCAVALGAPNTDAAWVEWLDALRHESPDFKVGELSVDSLPREWRPEPDFENSFPAWLFTVSGVKRMHWSNAGPIRRLFQEAFQRAAIQYFNPHSIRKTLVQLGEMYCRTPEEFKAWSQNLGHEGVLTTFYSYGAVQVTRQSEILRELAGPTQPTLSGNAYVLELVRRLNDHLAGAS